VGDGKGVAGVVVTDAHIGELKPSDGEIAVYAAGDASSPQELVSYLQWGSTPHPRTAAAVKAGLWPRTAYAPTAPNAVRLYRRPGGLWLFATAKSPDGT
jgi:hypothetical protein